jgi:hypothetical protein
MPEGEPPKGMIFVMPIQIDRSKGTDVASAEELTQLMLDKLQAYRVPSTSFEAAVTGPALRLACEVTELGYVQVGGYPRHLRYKAELACAIKDPVTHDVRWTRKLDQKYEESVLFNMMTKRPEHHDAVLYRECVVSLWDAMAYGVRLFMNRPVLAAPSAPEAPEPLLLEPPPPIDPPPDPYAK